MINGASHGFFPAQGGSRQGDPLSPFLFSIVREALSRMIKVAEEIGMINGFKLAVNTSVVMHLQFADDTLIFCAAEEEVKNVVAIIRCIEAVSGLKVNFFKSEL